MLSKFSHQIAIATSLFQRFYIKYQILHVRISTQEVAIKEKKLGPRSLLKDFVLFFCMKLLKFKHVVFDIKSLKNIY